MIAEIQVAGTRCDAVTRPTYCTWHIAQEAPNSCRSSARASRKDRWKDMSSVGWKVADAGALVSSSCPARAGRRRNPGRVKSDRDSTARRVSWAAHA